MPDMSYPVADGVGAGYLAVPHGAASRWPGVVVIHEAFGLTDDIRKTAEQLAAHGYLALAPDLYGGQSWIRCVRGVFRQLRARSGPAFTALDSARAYLAARADSTGKTGVIGFCMGGGFALLCAPRPGFGAASVNCGEVPVDAERALRGACPIVGSFGGRDQMGTKHPERLQRALAVLQVPHDVRVYPGAGHRFMSEPSGNGAVVFAKVTRMTYQPADAADAWRRTYAFFGEYLNSE